MGTEGEVIDIKQSHLRAQHWFFRQGRFHRCANGGYAAIAAHARDHLAFVAKQIFGDIPAAIHLADDLILGHNHIVEEGFAEGRIAGNQLDRLGRHTGRLHVEQ